MKKIIKKIIPFLKRFFTKSPSKEPFSFSCIPYDTRPKAKNETLENEILELDNLLERNKRLVKQARSEHKPDSYINSFFLNNKIVIEKLDNRRIYLINDLIFLIEKHFDHKVDPRQIHKRSGGYTYGNFVLVCTKDFYFGYRVKYEGEDVPHPEYLDNFANDSELSWPYCYLRTTIGWRKTYTLMLVSEEYKCEEADPDHRILELQLITKKKYDSFSSHPDEIYPSKRSIVYILASFKFYEPTTLEEIKKIFLPLMLLTFKTEDIKKVHQKEIEQAFSDL